MDKITKSVIDRLEKQEYVFSGLDYPLLAISTAYPGLWLEHVYDSIIYTKINKEKLYLAENAVKVFIEHQTEEGQLPCAIIPSIGHDGLPSATFNRALSRLPKYAPFTTDKIYFCYTQTQECVSFGSLCYALYELNGDLELLSKAFESVKKWLGWQKKYRMTTNRGLVEMFVGYDTGHDNSARVLDLACPRSYIVDGIKQNAKVMPCGDDIAPVIALDLNCIYYGNLIALSKMAKALGTDDTPFILEAKEIKKRIFNTCFDKETCFFYDVDKNGNKRKILSCQIFSLFIEGVLDKEEDKELINELCNRYIFNKNHFYTDYPFPSVSISDPTFKKHTAKNCWGYFTQGLTILRCTLWMEKYGFEKEYKKVLKTWVEAWEKNYGTLYFAQELDPITGEPSQSSEWYSACMLTYLYFKK